MALLQTVEKTGKSLLDLFLEPLKYTFTPPPTAPILPPVRQFQAAAIKGLTLGLVKPQAPEPQTIPEKVGKVVGTFTGMIPYYEAGAGLAKTGLQATKLGSALTQIPRLGRFIQPAAEVLGGGAFSSFATTPGGIKERAQAAAETFKPENLAFAAPFIAIGGVKAVPGISKLQAQSMAEEAQVSKDVLKEILAGEAKPSVQPQLKTIFKGMLAKGQLTPQQAAQFKKVIAATKIPQLTPKEIAKQAAEAVRITIPSDLDPVQKVIYLLKEAKPIRASQEALYSLERSKRAGAVKAIGEAVKGEKGYYEQLGKLKGPLPKIQFETLRKNLTQSDIDSLFNTIEENQTLLPLEKVATKTGLIKLFGTKGGEVPTKSELLLLNEVFPPEFTQAILDKRPLIQKLFSLGEEAINIPRAIMTSGDFSASLNQAAFAAPSHPRAFAGAFKAQFKPAFSEKAFQELQTSIQERPTYPLMRQYNLNLTNIGKFANQREEAFATDLAEKIPLVGKLVRGSQRAYVAMLNKFRADVFDNILRNNPAIQDNPEFLTQTADLVNNMTGRGKLPAALEKAAPLLNGLLFSPRRVASRLNLLNPFYYISLSPPVRKEALRSLFAFTSTGLTILGLAKLAGAKVGTEPRSSDWGKIKIGDTRYDIFAGFQQYARLAAQLITGKVISSTTGREITLGEGYKPLTRANIIARFVETKEAPVASFITQLLEGKTAIEESLNIPREVISRFIPMALGDVADLINERGLPGVAMGIPAIFGVGTQTYGKQQLTYGVNQLGQKTVEIQPVPELAEKISSKLLGPPALEPSTTFNIEKYYDQLLQMPREEAAKQFNEIRKFNPKLAQKILQVSKQRKIGITVQDQSLLAKGVTSGDRALEIAKQLKKLKTREEKAKLWQEYVRKKIINKDVAKQLYQLLQKGF